MDEPDEQMQCPSPLLHKTSLLSPQTKRQLLRAAANTVLNVAGSIAAECTQHDIVSDDQLDVLLIEVAQKNGLVREAVEAAYEDTLDAMFGLGEDMDTTAEKASKNKASDTGDEMLPLVEKTSLSPPSKHVQQLISYAKTYDLKQKYRSPYPAAPKPTPKPVLAQGQNAIPGSSNVRRKFVHPAIQGVKPPVEFQQITPYPGSRQPIPGYGLGGMGIGMGNGFYTGMQQPAYAGGFGFGNTVEMGAEKRLDIVNPIQHHGLPMFFAPGHVTSPGIHPAHHLAPLPFLTSTFHPHTMHNHANSAEPLVTRPRGGQIGVSRAPYHKWTPEERKFLKEAYAKNQTPTREECMAMVGEMGIDPENERAVEWVVGYFRSKKYH